MVPFKHGKQRRLAIALGGGALAGRPMIVAQGKQGRLPGLRQFPRLKLLAVQLAQALPTVGVTVNNEGVGLAIAPSRCVSLRDG
jgi:hypothetical protein